MTPPLQLISYKCVNGTFERIVGHTDDPCDAVEADEAYTRNTLTVTFTVSKNSKCDAGTQPSPIQ